MKIKFVLFGHLLPFELLFMSLYLNIAKCTAKSKPLDQWTMRQKYTITRQIKITRLINGEIMVRT